MSIVSHKQWDHMIDKLNYFGSPKFFKPINLFVHLICVSFKNTLYIKNTLSGVLAVSWGPKIWI